VVAGRKRANELKTMGVTETEWKRMKEIIDRERRKSRDLTLTGGTRVPPTQFARAPLSVGRF
jgi:hypothetical protein